MNRVLDCANQVTCACVHCAYLTPDGEVVPEVILDKKAVGNHNDGFTLDDAQDYVLVDEIHHVRFTPRDQRQRRQGGRPSKIRVGEPQQHARHRVF